MSYNIDNDVEILAPAGSYDAFVAAINAGAHAVYMGVNKFNARTMANNLSMEEYISAIDYAHKRDVKVYLTLNTLLFDDEIKEALEIVVKLYNVGLDAVIVQDLGIATLIHKVMPDLPLHASTQMSVLNLEQVKYLEKLGFSRVVLGRELSINEIKDICSNTCLEVEIFVHGALCVCVSGQCTASALIGERSANRGSCAQPCRMKYSLYKASSNKPIVSEKYILSKKDIYGLDKLKELKEAGVKSFKIEGRNRSVEYTAGVVARYREVVENKFNVKEGVEKELLQLFNRSGKSEGYLSGVKYKESISYLTPKNTGLVLGKVLAKQNGYIKLKLVQDIDMHDGVEILNEGGATSFIVTCIKDELSNIINVKCNRGDIVWLGDVKGKVAVGDVIYKTSNSKLNEEARQYLKVKEKTKRLEQNVIVNIQKDKNIFANVPNTNICVELEYVPELSKTVGVTIDKVKEVFDKTEDTSVKFVNVLSNIEDNLFVPVSKLNELRRLIVSKIEDSRCVRRNVDASKVKKELEFKINKKNIQRKENSLYMYKYDANKDYVEHFNNRYNKKLDRLYISARDFKIYEKDIMKYISKVQVYFVIPNVVLGNMRKYINENIERLIQIGVAGIVIGNIGYLDICNELKQKYNIKLLGDHSLNITNKYTAEHFKTLDYITLLFEINENSLHEIAKVVDVELIEGLATAMTTRYCMLASFIGNIETREQCNAACKRDEYYIVDTYGKKYNIITDNTDCITELVRNKRKYSDEIIEKYSTRYNIL